MTDQMHIAIRIVGGFVGITYAAIFFFLSMISFGGGHGTGFFLLMWLPFPFGLLFFPVIAVVAADLRTKQARILFLIVQGVHFILVMCGFALYLLGKGQSLSTVWPIVGGEICILFGMYIVGQIGLWYTFAKFYNGGLNKRLKSASGFLSIEL